MRNLNISFCSLSACIEANINWQQFPNCGVPKKAASANIFANALQEKFKIRKRRGADAGSYDYINLYESFPGTSGSFSDFPQFADINFEAIDVKTELDSDSKPTDPPTADQIEKAKNIIKHSNQTARIVGGQSAQENSWPWQIHLSVCGKWYGILECNICGGSLISPKYVVSAAHCVPSEAAGTVILGASDINLGGDQQTSVEEFIIHDSWNHPNMFDNDISLLKLKQLAVISDNVSPICLPHPETCFDPKIPCVVTGWGLIDERGGFPSMLQEVAVRLISDSTCKTYSGYDGTLTDKMFCAGFKHGTMDACAGDSGGPLVCSVPEERMGGQNGWVLYGIVSWGYGCARPNSPGVYTRVTKMVEFIKRVTGLTADPRLNYKDEGCAAYNSSLEENWETEYVTKYNENQAFGVNLSEIQWDPENYKPEEEEAGPLVTKYCDYTQNNDFGQQNFTTELVGDRVVNVEISKNHGANQRCIWRFKNTKPKDRFISLVLEGDIRLSKNDIIRVLRSNDKPYTISRTKKAMTFYDPAEIVLEFISNGDQSFARSNYALKAEVKYKKLTFMCDGFDNVLLRSGRGGRALSQSNKEIQKEMTLYSENSPKIYSPFSQCRWYIEAEQGLSIGIFIKFFKTERTTSSQCTSKQDNLIIFEADNCETDTLKTAKVWGTLCGTQPNNKLKYNTGIRKMCAVFLADGDRKRGRGFAIEVHQLDQNHNVIPSHNSYDPSLTVEASQHDDHVDGSYGVYSSR